MDGVPPRLRYLRTLTTCAALALAAAPRAFAQRSVDTATAGTRIDLEAVPIVARIALPASPDWIGLGFGSVWVVNYRPDRVSRIGLADNRVVADIPIGRNGCLGIVVGDERVWVATCGDGMMNEIDPATNTIARRVPIPVARGREGSFAVADGSFWIPDNATDSTSSTIARIDAKGGDVIVHVATGRRSDVAIAAFSSVWVASSAEGVVSRIDPSTNREMARIQTHAPTQWGDIAVGGGAVWLAVNGKPITRIDPRTNTVTHQVVGGDGADAIRFGAGALWVADHQHGQLWRVDTTGVFRRE